MSNFQPIDPSTAEQYLKVGDRLRFGVYDCTVKELMGEKAKIYHDKMGEMVVPTLQPISLINRPVNPQDAASARGPVADRVDSRCRACGTVYRDMTLPKAQEKHGKEQRCNGRVTLFEA